MTKSANKPLKALGLCLGASTISLVEVQQSYPAETDGHADRPRVLSHALYPHEGDPKRTLVNALKGLDLKGFDRIAVTGRRFRQLVRLSAVSEPEAVELAYRFVKPPRVECPAVVSAGGETFMVYVLNRSGRITNVITGNKCASGTGEFFLQQLRRMNVSLEQAASWAATEAPHHVSGRCSVFCKSDCTHATNKGVPKSKVTAGLCQMMANKILALLKNVTRCQVMLTGGTSRNRMMVACLQKEIEGLIVPEQAPYFEALGAALWALQHPTRAFTGFDQLFVGDSASFDTLAPLSQFAPKVEFKTMARDHIRPGDECLVGLDVGSTTTKAVLLRRADNALLASVYLRTSGDPVGASQQCYQALWEEVRTQIDPSQITITGLGVCGSGRQIAGLHALTDGVVNEIIAHANAAVHFDPQVDTIFEIGGQDAKYTYITNGVASDYAMNEACSAGTGSFLEESAYETLGVQMVDIEAIALQGRRPPNFNDQCAAFIASDIKNAIHEGIAHEDIVAGLVYSICMNYSNRVKGNRPVGEKVFMQGGVCYNKAVPLAMAALVGKPMVVPPEPGLMGAFGAALEVKKRLQAGLMQPQRFELQQLLRREVRYGKSFVCSGGREHCDRRCEIAMIEIEGQKFPFGGACNRYYNLRRHIRYDVKGLNLVRQRQQLIFNTCGASSPPPAARGTIGINRSFLVNTYYPLYARFFQEVGFAPVIPGIPSAQGIDRREAAFCYPAELAHGFFYQLLTMEPRPDFIFLPHFKAVPKQNGASSSQVCPFVQGETFYLQNTFRHEIKALEKRGTRVLAPMLDLTQGLQAARQPLVATARAMGASRPAAEAAIAAAIAEQRRCLDHLQEIGRNALTELAADPDRIGVVIFARPYNGFADEANMGIPHKLASRGVLVLPLDVLPIEHERARHHMYWGMGQMILKAARLVKRHPQLFGTYITNFSCGPDSFIIGYFRELMGSKPSLTLELDSHTADAGLETRIEAFLDIVAAYRKLDAQARKQPSSQSFVPAQISFDNGLPAVVTSKGRRVPMTDKRVTMLFPSMGHVATEALAAVFRKNGFQAVAHPPAGEAELKLGRANTSCKECLPLILTTGSLLNYVAQVKKKDEILVYFMATGSGPCRFGQYTIFLNDLVRRLQLPDVALFSLTSENGYDGLGGDVHRRAWWAVVSSDVLEDIRSMLLAAAVDPEEAMRQFERQWRHIVRVLEHGSFRDLERQLARTAQQLGAIELQQDPRRVPTVSLVGEIFVRRDALSRQYLTERLAQKGFATICAPVAEWLHYCDYLMDKGLSDQTTPQTHKLSHWIKKKYQAWYERRIKSILARSGLVHAAPVHVPTLVNNAKPYISPSLTGEAVLTVGSALTDVVSHSCGVIAIGPFGCMPNRMSEAILSRAMTLEGKLATEPHNGRWRALSDDVEELPFLAIESDGSPFPQVINAKLETFCLRAERLHERMLAVKD